MKYNPIIVALDFSDFETTIYWRNHLKDYVGGFKLGLEYLTFYGPFFMENLFIDLKLHDIPTTVAKSVKNLKLWNPKFISVHAAGGIDMMKAAKAEAGESKIMGVLSLTSRTQHFTDIYYMAKECALAEIDGVICSGKYSHLIKQEFPQLEIISPGIRLDEHSLDEHKIFVTPKEAIDNGSDWLVIGRPIIQADNPLTVIERILNEI